MKISLIHPSRGRHAKARETWENWIRKSKDHTRIETILSLDYSDPLRHYYKADGITKVIANNNTCVVDATNNAAKQATGDIIIYLSDDFDCPDNWDELLINRVKDLGPDWLLKVDDCLQPFDNTVLTIPIMSKGLYNVLGYFWHPSYKSMWVDVDLYYTVSQMGVLNLAPELKFEHLHYTSGKSPKDEIYKASSRNWNQGVDAFNKRSVVMGWNKTFDRV